MQEIMNAKIRRYSNIELLRIISILMIIGSHMVIYGIIELPNESIYVEWGTGTILNRLFASLLVPGGDIGVGVFFLITGYFMIDKEKPRSIIGVLGEVLFYGITGMVVYILIFLFFHSELNVRYMLNNLFTPISGNVWWFASAYTILLLISPYINYFFKNLNSTEIWTLILIMWALLYVNGKVFNVYYYALIRAAWFYITGGGIKKREIKLSKKLCGVIFVINWLLYSGCTYIIGMSTISSNGDGIVCNLLKLIRLTIFSPIGSVALFLMFLSLTLAEWEFVNNVAKHCFGIYLLHEMPIMRELLWVKILAINKVYETMLFIPWCIISVAIVFMVGIILDKLRIEIYKVADRRWRYK